MEHYNSDRAFIAGKKAAGEVADRARRKIGAQRAAKRPALVLSGD
jgi:hypothetical protein